MNGIIDIRLMMSITCFDDLPDLVLIELFSYLSSFDILWGLTRLNERLTTLIIERGYFHHINLSNARYHQFKTIVDFLPLNEIESIVIDTEASPLQLTHWPYLPRLRTLRIVGPYSLDDLSIYLLLHAATITHLIIKSNERLVPDCFLSPLHHSICDMTVLLNNIILIHLPELRSFDMGTDYSYIRWKITTRMVPLRYLRLHLLSVDTIIDVMSTRPLCDTLRELHVIVGTSRSQSCYGKLTSKISIEMVHLHTFTFLQKCFSSLTIEWADFEVLTSSKVMPVLRRVNVSIFLSINSLNCLRSSSLFTDHRHVDVHFAFHLINYPEYLRATQFIPHGNNSYPREIVGAKFVIVKEWSGRTQCSSINDDPFIGGLEYDHYMWYTLPGKFDEFFHEDVPRECIIKTEIFYKSSEIGNNESSLRTFNACGQTSPSILSFLPHVVLFDRIETLHLSFCTRPLYIEFSNLRLITLMNSINYLNFSSSFPRTVRSVHILLFDSYPNFILPNWPIIFASLSTLTQLNSLRIFIYDSPIIVDDECCQMMAKMAHLLNNFNFCYRDRGGLTCDEDREKALENYIEFIKELYRYIVLFSVDKEICCSIEGDGCGLLTWF